MKNILAIAVLTLFIVSSCNQKANDQNQDTQNTNQQTTSKDSISKVEQEKKDAAHGHTH
ncbi:hypothetical protein LNQ49_18060 [Flavobacterium sp. F-65]|uniref:Lipoprotein n=1 Tax=Flavobacterium pisciphilum TaxID=2893755 RepID=A0ABS8MXI1_9FLAO|nr:hypothetical protein [Flavobacterium sp. F-65]MCC9073484.1 hypothetical protein [Flavobacterium sp. F-65]